MVGAILGGLSAVASGISAIQNFQQAKQAQRAANMFGKQLEGIKETNVFAGLQAPDVSSLQAQQIAQQTAGATQAVQGMGTAGAAQIANIYQAGLQQTAENMQRQAEINYQTEMAKRQAEQNVQFRNVERERGLVGMRLAGAQERAAEKRLAGQQAIGGIVGGLGMAAGDIAGLTNYGQPDFKTMQSQLQANNQKRKDIKSGQYFSFDQSTPAYEGEFDAAMIPAEQSQYLSNPYLLGALSTR